MKEKIFINMCISTLIGFVLCSVIFLAGFYNLLKTQTFESLQNQTVVIKENLKQNNYNINYLNFLKTTTPDVRLTLINKDGTVLFDSRADVSNMDNHINRDEIKDAVSKGIGKSVRFSSTLSQNTYYYAALLDNNNVLRLSKETSSVFKIFFDAFPLIFIIIIIIFIICIVLSKRLSQAILKPLEDLGDNLDNIKSIDYYDEFSPIFNRIITQNKQINNQLSALNERKDTLNTITANMKEGLILLDEKKNILSVNKSAIAFLKAKEKDYTMQNLLSLCRIPSLVANIDKALLGQSYSFEIDIDDNYYEVILNPYYEQNQLKGVIILLLDITQKVKSQKMKQDFSANVSHELRTPLTTISGFAEMINSDMVKNKEDVKNFVTLIYNESRRLITLVDDIMQLSQIEESNETKFENVDLFEICKNIAMLLSPHIQQKKLNVSFIINKSDSIVYSNKRMMEELIYNLFENSIKYNKENGDIIINIDKTENSTVFSISDTGIGIPKEHQQRVFERFYRVDKSRSKATGGTGLGLSIVKHIIEYHKGKINLESTFGKGTKITITI